MLYLCITTIASYFAPHADCTGTHSLHKNDRVPGNEVRFDILKRAVAVRSAIYLYLEIKGDSCRAVWLAISSDF